MNIEETAYQAAYQATCWAKSPPARRATHWPTYQATRWPTSRVTDLATHWATGQATHATIQDLCEVTP